MKKTAVTVKKETEMNKIQKIGRFLNRNNYVIAFAFVLCFLQITLHLQVVMRILYGQPYQTFWKHG